MTLEAGKLHLSRDRKVTNIGYYRGEYRGRDFGWLARTPNSFGLPSGVSCPGKTDFCLACYGANTEKYQNVLGALTHNWNLLKDAPLDQMRHLITHMIGRYWTYAENHVIPPEDRIFRIHWDGDFFSEDYARAWAAVIRGYQGQREIKFWAYTRSFRPPVNVVPILAGIPNLKLYLSADEWNVDDAHLMVAQYPDVLLALCAIDYQVARTLTTKEGEERSPVVCPENSGRIPLNTEGVGACVSCKLCPDGRRDVIFSITHRESQHVEQPRLALTASTTASVCANPECGKPLARRSGKGRPLKWCDSKCRNRMYYLTRRRSA